MTSLLLPVLGAEAFGWLVAILAAGGGIALHVTAPPSDPDVAEAILVAMVHP